VRPTSSGVGLPSSTYSVPPWKSTRLKLWLAPKVWLHGSQSSTTGGRSRTKGHSSSMARWLEHSIRWVLITPLGCPVEPEVKSTLATASGPCAWNRSSTSGPGSCSRSAPHGSIAPEAPRPATIAAPPGARAASARP
jgi:hypothetical protein